MEPLMDPQHQIRLMRLLPAEKDDIISLKCSVHDFAWPSDIASSDASGAVTDHVSPGINADKDILSDGDFCDADSPDSDLSDGRCAARSGNTPYFAISYTWGECKDSHEVIVNGANRSVHQNCHYALWQARLHHPGAYVWIDALCIDQQNLAEKGQQVAIMGKIFAEAVCVLSCVGPSSYDSELAFQWCTQYTSRLEAEHGCRQNDNFWALHFQVWEQMMRQEPSEHEHATRACKAFTNRRYWSRVWVLQEVARATRFQVLCGELSLPWEMMETLKEWPDVSHSAFDSVLDTREEVQDSDDDTRDLIDRLGDFECADIRDRIYGVLDLLIIQGTRLPIMPDYNVTTLALVVRVVENWTSITFGNVYDLLSILRIYSNEPELIDLVTERRQRRMRRSLGTTEHAQPGYEFSAICIPLHKDSSRRLTASLTLKNRLHHIDTETLLLDAAQALELTAIPGDITQVYAGNDVVAIVSGKARPGDCLAQMANGILLVLRPLQVLEFEIIGQGFAFGLACTDKTSCFCSQQGLKHDVLYGRVLRTTLAAEDIVVLAAQDFNRPYWAEDDILNEDYDYSARARRAITGVSKGPNPIAVMDATVNAGVSFEEDKTHRVAGWPYWV